MLWPLSADAAMILTSPAQFTSANIIVQFEVFPDGQPVPYNSGTLSNQWQSLGLLIADATPENGASAYNSTGGGASPPVPPHSGTHALGNSDSGAFIELRFVIPNTNNFGVVEEAGLWVQTPDTVPGFPPRPSTVTFFDINGAVLGSRTTSTTDEFIGISAPEGVALIRIDGTNVFLVDDVQFSPVPEPAGLRLILAVASILAMRSSQVAGRQTHPQTTSFRARFE
jgi:hypothetical protein